MTPEELNAYALERLADGDLLAEIADEVGVKRTTMFMRLHASPELVDAYARAREEGLHVRAERLRKKAARALPLLASGGIDPAAVSQLKLEIDTDKWTLAKLLPKVYGDKVEQTIQGPGGAPVSLTVQFVKPGADSATT